MDVEKAMGIAMLALLVAGCGDDDSPGDGGVDAEARDAGAMDAATDATDAGPLAPFFQVRLFERSTSVVGVEAILRDASGELHESTSNDEGIVGFDLDPSDWPIELTLMANGFVPVSFVGFDRTDFDYFDERGLFYGEPHIGERGIERISLPLTRVPSVRVSGTQVGGTGDVLLVETSRGGDAFVGSPGPWSISTYPHELGLVVGWIWTQQDVPEPRSLAWDVDVAVLEVSTLMDRSGLELDFSSEEELVSNGFAFRLPEGEPFFDEATPIGTLLAGGESMQPGMTVGFPVRTRWDEASRTLAVETVSPASLDDPFVTQWEMAQLVSDAGGSIVFHPRTGEGETFDANFLVPPALNGETADGIAFGEPVRWAPDDEELLEWVVYQVEGLDGMRPWFVQAWGDARGASAPPQLPAEVLDRLLGSGPLQAFVGTCDFQLYGWGAGGCIRTTQSPFFGVSRTP